MNTRRSFLTVLAATPLPFFTRWKIESPLEKYERLSEQYCVASVQLRQLAEKMGLVPEVRVSFKSEWRYPGETLFGTICDFGPDWNGNSALNVPVNLDKGYRQPWRLCDLNIVEK